MNRVQPPQRMFNPAQLSMLYHRVEGVINKLDIGLGKARQDIRSIQHSDQNVSAQLSMIMVAQRAFRRVLIEKLGIEKEYLDQIRREEADKFNEEVKAAQIAHLEDVVQQYEAQLEQAQGSNIRAAIKAQIEATQKQIEAMKTGKGPQEGEQNGTEHGNEGQQGEILAGSDDEGETEGREAAGDNEPEQTAPVV